MAYLKCFFSAGLMSILLVGCSVSDHSNAPNGMGNNPNDGDVSGILASPEMMPLAICDPVSYTVDDMDFSVGGATSDGHNIWSEGTGTVSHDFVAGEQTVTVSARGEIAGGAGPNMVVRVGGSVIGNLDIMDTTMQPYSFTWDAPGGVQQIEVEFTNDYYNNPEDRNLIVGGISVTCSGTTPDTDTSVDTDTGLAPGTDWITTWVSAQQLTESHNNPPSPGLSGNTLRQNVLVTLGGSQMRFTFSNEYGNGPLVISGAAVANNTGGSAIDTGSHTPLTFSGSPSVTIPAGGMVTSDTANFAVAPLTNLSVTIRFGASVPGNVTGHPGSRTTSYLQSGDGLAAANMYSAATTDHWYILSSADVVTTDTARAVTIIGDSITDGRGSTTNGNDRWPNRLAERLLANPSTENIAVLNQGVGGNCVIHNCLGPSAVSRFNRDALGPLGVDWVIILEGINDLGNFGSMTANQMISAFTQMAQAAHAAGASVIGGTIMPCGGNAYYNATMESKRQAINDWVRTTSVFDAVIDFDAITRDPLNPSRLSPSVDGGDGLHPDAGGYQIMADAIALSLFGGTVNPYCGDGNVDAGEACDDGNSSNADACLNSCEVAACGDGFVHVGVEACDDGNLTGGDGCDATCQYDGTCIPASYNVSDMTFSTGGSVSDGYNIWSNGTGTVEHLFSAGDVTVTIYARGELAGGSGPNMVVSVGGTVIGDITINAETMQPYEFVYTAFGGDETIAVEFTNDYFNDPNDRNLIVGGIEVGCQAEPAVCGDGVVDAGEACDDGNDDNTDECLNTCQNASCGDGFVQAGVEVCDDGNSSNADACLNTCEAATCGDGFVQTGVEDCDDANGVETDSCLSDCTAASCGDGIVWSGVEECDDANDDNTDDCLNTCQTPSCGDGFIQAGEDCDDGNGSNTDDCLTTCETAACGDGFIQAAVEACDDGNLIDGDGCDATCQSEVTCTPTVYSVDDMAFSTGGSVSDGYNIWSEGTGTVSHLFSAGAVTITVYARGEIAGGSGPNMLVSVGGTVIGNITINDETMQPYEFDYAAFGGNEPITVEFTNDYYSNPDDRNLIVGSIEVGCQAGAGVCGDGVVDAGETCDDGNTTSGDGCDAICQIEGTGSGPFQEQSGMVVMEAENYDVVIDDGATDDTWNEIADGAASVGTSMQVGPDSGDYHTSQSDVEANATRLDYAVNFTTTGTWYLWVRGASQSTMGYSSNSCHGGIDGVAEALYMNFASSGTYSWVQKPISVSSAGEHTIHLFMREDGFIADKIILTTSSSYTPSGISQPESPRL